MDQPQPTPTQRVSGKNPAASNSSFNKGGSGDIKAAACGDVRTESVDGIRGFQASELHPSCADLKGAPNAMGFAKHSSALDGNKAILRKGDTFLKGIPLLGFPENPIELTKIPGSMHWFLNEDDSNVTFDKSIPRKKRNYCGVSLGHEMSSVFHRWCSTISAASIGASGILPLKKLSLVICLGNSEGGIWTL